MEHVTKCDKCVICTLYIIRSVATRIMSFMINIEFKLLKFNPIMNKLIGQYFDLRLLCVVHHCRFLILDKNVPLF